MSDMTQLPSGDFNMPPGVRAADIPSNQPKPRRNQSPAFTVERSTAGYYEGVYQVWNQDGNEITKEQDKKILALFRNVLKKTKR